MLNMDAGSRILGEAAFGLNYGIERFTRNILFDEKIGGTMHMALGSSYPETAAKTNPGCTGIWL
jgi:aminopeptidase